jgi:glycosyltransferase involved in cell wall biosynthesis
VGAASRRALSFYLMPRFSIITPSFRNGEWLRLCIASIADQGVSLEHIVQDAGSDDGTLDWLPHDLRVQAFVEKDSGMYDAINRGFRKAKGDIVAYLNCDEQYLPGALQAVEAEFAKRPELDALLTDLVVVDDAGGYLCHRRSMVPLKSHLWLRFNVTTCSVFLRRSSLERMDLYFDTRWKALGDLFWYRQMLLRGARIGVLRKTTSVFTETGTNLALSATGLAEREEKVKLTPTWVRKAAPLILAWHRLRLFASGTFFQKPFSYDLYTRASPTERVTKHVSKPQALWKRPG